MDELLKEDEYSKIFAEEFDKQQESLKQLNEKKLIISLVGNVNSGKSSTINALTGKKLADVRARAGWTKKVSIHAFSQNVFIADTPGLEDINEEVSMRAEEFIEAETDIIIFFINAAVGLTKNEKKAINAYIKMGKPLIIVINKIDILADEEEGLTEDNITEVASQTFEETGIVPVLISAKHKINIDLLHQKILDVLSECGKELLFLKISRLKETQVDIWINAATASAGVIGALPIPGSDFLPLTAVQVGLATKIAYIYNCKISKEDAMQFIAATITGRIGRNIYRAAITVMKGLGWLSGGPMEVPVMAVASGVAASTTYAFGRAANFYYKNDMQVSLDEVNNIFSKAHNEYKSQQKN